jgi:hypothetical protein
MFRHMYLLLSRTAFCLLSNPVPQAIYYGQQTLIVNGVGNPVLNVNRNPTYVPLPALDCATQATIDARFVQARNYWLSYQNIKQAWYNMLDDGINNVFKFSPDPDIMGWNPFMEIVEIMDQPLTTYSRLTTIVLLQNDTLSFAVCIPPSMRLKSSSAKLRIVKKSRPWGLTRIPPRNS